MDTCGRYRTAIGVFPPAVFIELCTNRLMCKQSSTMSRPSRFSSSELPCFPPFPLSFSPTTTALMSTTLTNIVIPDTRGYARLRILRYSFVEYFFTFQTYFFHIIYTNLTNVLTSRTWRTVVSQYDISKTSSDRYVIIRSSLLFFIFVKTE